MIMEPPASAVKNQDTDAMPVIIAEGLTKEFVIPHERRTTLFENLRGIIAPNTYEKFTALKDVSFTVNKGDALGIIGDNGSGKSTLLKIICNILKPSEGKISVSGVITPFLELGVGFQYDLTSRENIEIYGTIMGLTGRQIAENMDKVLDFAGLQTFRDTKLKNLSSGMQVRLAFATAIQMVPDILVVDEVLAVGDMEFQQKCFDVFREYKKKGVTLVFVSHDMESIRRFCDKALLLRKGKVIAFGPVNDVIDRYVYGSRSTDTEGDKNHGSSVSESAMQVPLPESSDSEAAAPQTRWGNRAVEIIGLEFIDKFGNDNVNFVSGDPLSIRIKFDARRKVDDLIFGLIIYSEAGIYCYGTTTELKKYRLGCLEGSHKIDFIIDRLPLLNGRYFVTIAASSSENVVYDWHDRMYSFVVHNDMQDLGLFRIPCRWELD